MPAWRKGMATAGMTRRYNTLVAAAIRAKRSPALKRATKSSPIRDFFILLHFLLTLPKKYSRDSDYYGYHYAYN